MTSLRVSDFDPATALDGSEVVGVVQGLANRKTTTEAIAALASSDSGGISKSVSVGALSALDVQPTGTQRYLAQAGREGMFAFYVPTAPELAWFVARVTEDTLNGVYVPPTSDLTGASGAWVREGNRLDPFMFGGDSNHITGNRATGVPAYGEGDEPGEIDGVLADATAACQAVINAVTNHTNRYFAGDFSGGVWGISDRGDGLGLEWNITPGHRRIFVGGDFRGIGGGDILLKITAASYSHFFGNWHIRSGADLGSSFAYASRQWETGFWVRGASMTRFGNFTVSGFQRWGIEYDRDPDTTNNNNIGARFHQVYANNNGSACDRGANSLDLTFTGATNTGPSNGYAQRTNLPLGVGHEILRVDDVIRSPAGSYHTVMEKVGATASVYPWFLSTANGSITCCHGGAMRVRGPNVAGCGADMLTGITNGATLDISTALHGTEFGNVIQEGGGLGLIIGTIEGSNLGHTISHMHSEANTLDLLSISVQDVGLMIGACSAWADMNFADPFALTEILTPNDGVTIPRTYGLPHVTLNLNGTWINSGSMPEDQALVPTKSRTYGTLVLSNNPGNNEMVHVQPAGTATNITLRYHEATDRCIRHGFVTRARIVGAAGGAPTDTITVNIDAKDAAPQWLTATAYTAWTSYVKNAGHVYLATNTGTSGATAPTHTSGDVTDGTVIWRYVQPAMEIEFIGGTTASTYVITGGTATGPVDVEFWLDTNGTTRRWIVVKRQGAP